MADFAKIGVIGAGQMGHGIAQVCAASGFGVRLVDVDAGSIEKAKVSIEKSLSKMVSKEKISADQKQATMGNLTYGTKIDELADVDLAIEAIVENEQIKRELFQKLDGLMGAGAILASNTSSIPITRLGAMTKRSDKFIGMHFMNPVPIMKLVEVIPGLATSGDTTTKIVSLAEKLGKTVVKSQDYPGFIVNRILMPMINEAFKALMEGVASPEDIDNGMTLGCNQPMGPLKLADFIGLDTCKAILEVMYDGLGNDSYAPCPLLNKYVEAGYLGVKSGRGVYEYGR